MTASLTCSTTHPGGGRDAATHVDLDGLLRGWAARQRIGEVQATTMLQVILTDPNGLPPSWWADFGARLSTVMLRATGVTVAA